MKSNHNKLQQRGFVLITVLLLLILLSAFLLRFCRACQLNLRTADNTYIHKQALHCAQAGLNFALAALSDSTVPPTNSSLSRLLDGTEKLSLGNGSCTIIASSENGKINLNLLKDNNCLDQTRINQLLRLIDLTNAQQTSSPISYEFVPAVIDWTDPDNDLTILPSIGSQNSGAESSYYRSLPTSYPSANRPLETLGELLLVKNISAESLYLPSHNNPQSSTLIDNITIYGDGKIDINHAPRLVLASLSEMINPAIAQLIIEHRKYRPFERPEQLKDIPGITPTIFAAISPYITTTPTDRYYRITVQATVQHAVKTIKAIIKQDTKTNKNRIVLYQES